VISGKFEIDKLNEEYNLGLPEGDYETIGGFITAHIGRIPKKGETLEIKGFRINVLHSDKTKINLIKLFKE
jgi:CBS domain containing-hemolysin-like protein